MALELYHSDIGINLPINVHPDEYIKDLKGVALHRADLPEELGDITPRSWLLHPSNRGTGFSYRAIDEDNGEVFVHGVPESHTQRATQLVPLRVHHSRFVYRENGPLLVPTEEHPYLMIGKVGRALMVFGAIFSSPGLERDVRMSHDLDGEHQPSEAARSGVLVEAGSHR